MRNLPDWYDRAACKGADPDHWFLDRGESSAIARQTCRACPVLSECWEWAISGYREAFGTHPEGMWAGTNQKERSRWRGAA